MEPLKSFILNEVKNSLVDVVKRNRIKKSSKQLFEAVTLSESLKKGNNLSKIKLSEKAVRLAEKELIENYNEYDGDCDCGEGEGRMLRAQLSSIIDNAQKLLKMINEEDQFEDWIQSKVTIAEDYMRAAYSYMTHYESKGEMDISDREWDDDIPSRGMTPESGTVPEPIEIVTAQVRVEPMPDAPSVNMSNYSDALSPDIDDDEMFQHK